MEFILLAWTFASIYLSYTIGKFLINRANVFSLNKTNQNGIRFSSQSKPIYGGVMLYVVFVFSVIFSLMISNDPETAKHLLTFLLTATIGFFVGLADDLVSPSPLFKFMGQTLVAISLISLNVMAHVTGNFWFDAVLTFVWVIGIMNSINLLDNMDAISGSVSVLVLIAVLFILLMSDHINFPMVILLAGTIGSLLGFLKFNWFPSKMYMGDNGSQFLGALLAVVGIMFFWNVPSSVEISFAKSFWVTVLAFLIPIIDTTTVFINRIARKQSPFIGGKDHTTHHLFYLGLSVKQVAITMSFLTILSLGLSLYIIKFVEHWSVIHSIIFGGYSTLVFAVIYMTTKISKPKEQTT